MGTTSSFLWLTRHFPSVAGLLLRLGFPLLAGVDPRLQTPLTPGSPGSCLHTQRARGGPRCRTAPVRVGVAPSSAGAPHTPPTRSPAPHTDSWEEHPAFGERTGWGWGWPFSLPRADFRLCGFRTPFARGAVWAWRNAGAGFPHISQTRAEESPLLVPRLPRGPGLALAEMLRGHSPEPTFTEHLLQPELGIPRPLSENAPPCPRDNRRE